MRTKEFGGKCVCSARWGGTRPGTGRCAEHPSVSVSDPAFLDCTKLRGQWVAR